MPTTLPEETAILPFSCESAAFHFRKHEMSSRLTTAARKYDCFRYFPRSLEAAFDTAIESPRSVGDGPAWSTYRLGLEWSLDTTYYTAPNADQGSNFASPTSLGQCITLCQSLGGRNILGVIYRPSPRSCNCVDGNPNKGLTMLRRSSNSDIGGGQIVWFESCATTTGLCESHSRPC